MENCKMEIAELQDDMDTKRGYSDNCLADFYKLNVESSSICSAMQEKLSPSLVAATAVSNSFKK